MKTISILCFCLWLFNMSAQDMVLMSYNIRFDNPGDGPNRWDQRKDYLFSQIRYAGPAVFGIQEGLVDQVKALDSALSDFSFVGVARDDGRQSGEYSALFYNRNLVELLDEGTFWLSTTPEKPSKGWDAALPRICTFGRFRQRSSQREFMVFNTHFDHVGVQARQESAALLLRKIVEINRDQLPVALMGDFNLEPESEGIRRLTSRLIDAHTAAGDRSHGPAGTFNAFDVTRPATRRIDYVFLSPGDWEVRRSAILSDCFDGRFPSDHFPVSVTLGFAGR